jgi:hypothetical protein
MPSWTKTLLMKLLAQDLGHNPSETDLSINGLFWAPGAPPQKSHFFAGIFSGVQINTRHTPTDRQIKGRRTAVMALWLYGSIVYVSIYGSKYGQGRREYRSSLIWTV